nr:MAG TPA: hypothetical protein [Caudoviricetes sp.]
MTAICHSICISPSSKMPISLKNIVRQIPTLNVYI